MSIKRISRMRVAASIGEYVDEEPSATIISMEDARTGGNVETKSSPDTARTSPDTARDAPTVSRSSV